ncbi:prephenate dehydrogenase/arogenate dehydrogenase family protein [Verrucomicrobiales bacterium]|jgi:prephenate dehydrogenase|nr:prephenate dehydrogenase/arogenate dehydrogenase family protein [Verrucomicrobiales bacterium]
MSESGLPFRSVAVLGPGLIGGSLILAIRSRWPDCELRCWARREEAVVSLRQRFGNALLSSTSVAEVVEGAECVILAMPTGAMADVVAQMKPFPDSHEVIVTDVGSVKGPVQQEIGSMITALGADFVGSHPMAGSEKSGLDHADGDLFESAAVIMTPEAVHSEALISRLQRFWEGLGAVVSRLTPTAHDELVARISHLPHLVAAALVRSMLRDDPEAAKFSGGGFRDTTRLAGGLESMWTGILADNQEAVSGQLSTLISELESWKVALDTLDREQLQRFLSEARSLRETL